MESRRNSQSHFLYPAFSFIGRDFSGANAATESNIVFQESDALLPRCQCLYCVLGVRLIPSRPCMIQPQIYAYNSSFPFLGYPTIERKYSSGSPERDDKETKLDAKTLMKPKAKQSGPFCKICDKRFARLSTLKIHLRIHSGEKPFKCTHCPKIFAQSGNLVAHVRTHTGEKPYECYICHKRFSQSSSVTAHVRTHTGERPFQCRQCGKCFTDRSTLSKHGRVHQKIKTMCVIEGPRKVKIECGSNELQVASRG